MSGEDQPEPRRSLGRDRFSIAGKFERPRERYDVVVVGAGKSGLEAARLEAAAGGRVLLVDENPVSAALIGLDVPLYYGGRASAAVQNPGRMLEEVFNAEPRLEALMEAGVELALGTCAWGAFVNREGLNALPEPLLGLADQTASWMCGFGKLIIATGARDQVFSFQGWDQPGVMGAKALASLLNRYDAFAGRTVVVLGSGASALNTALQALEKGLTVAALVEVRPIPQGPEDLVEAVAAAGVPILTSHVVLEAAGGIDGVERVRLVSLADPDAAPIDIACDTVCQAIALTPVVELLDVLGAKLAFAPDRGGHVPVLDGDQTSLSRVYAVGACAGLQDVDGGPAYALDWMAALLKVGGSDVVVCQCEEVDRAAILGVRPPSYLGPPPAALEKRSLVSLCADGPVNQDQIKRLTRACMGPCQARRCREQVAMMLSLATGAPLGSIPLAGYRAPVRPLPLSVMADRGEAQAMEMGWDVWFGIPSQWIPYRDIGTEREALHVSVLGGDMHL